MNAADPIKLQSDLQKIKDYYRCVHPQPRNYLLIIIGLNTALRISDILKLKWQDVYDLEAGKIRTHLTVREQKTKKISCIYMNENISGALDFYITHLTESGKKCQSQEYLFSGQKNTNLPITRVQAFRIIRKAAEECGIEGVISCHSLRKTFGYYAWKQGTSPALLMNIYNHSSYQITKCYLGIDQDDRDSVFQNVLL